MKKQIRREILQARMALDDETVTTRSGIICGKLLAAPFLQKAGTVMAYLPFRKEVDLTSLFDPLWAAGKRVVIPVCDRKNVALIPSELKNAEKELCPGTWGIMEPKPGFLRPVAPEAVDLILVPGVAFDFHCNRLGYGGGYYDRFIPRLRENTPKVGVAFQLQIVEMLMPDAYDIPMDAVLTEEREYHRRQPVPAENPKKPED